MSLALSWVPGDLLDEKEGFCTYGIVLLDPNYFSPLLYGSDE